MILDLERQREGPDLLAIVLQTLLVASLSPAYLASTLLFVGDLLCNGLASRADLLAKE